MLTNTRLILIITMLTLTISIVGGIILSDNKTEISSIPILSQNKTYDIQDFNNGVYFFGVRGEDFGLALSKFIRENQNLTITNITVAIDRVQRPYGYWVICEHSK